ncbi:DDE-type integrase/transposase/recombinase [Paenibacillus spiritus]|uniref:DDE-type integrase/transposase/recombinase n=1 Tax=Paenibacillus spiritus TaxID=2496557 RepID=A0A5J5FS40_9BACL|nr:Mu transposase C-terminal domain-containing protein [Paenibacillus spiritus]KAA8995699.1 DDE-type integrase/transposase/recombinase [Paenibacillus spiritus]
MGIVVNSVIERLTEDYETEDLLRVLWIDGELENLVLMSIKDIKKKRMPIIINYAVLLEEIAEGKSRIIEFDEDIELLSPDEDYLEKYRENRNRRWELIKEIAQREPDIYLSKSRGQLLRETYLVTGKPVKVIKDYLLKYWFHGKSINGLLDNYLFCGGPGKGRVYKQKPGPYSKNRYIVTETDIEIFKSSIRLFHIRQGMNILTTYERMCETFYKRGYYRKYGVRVPIIDPDRSPSLRQFRYWYTNNTSAFGREENKRGKRRATMNVRPLVGNASERAHCVGAVYEVDATKSDIILVSFDRKTILGKPTLYVVIDVFSRLIVGYHVSLASESWFEAMVAVNHAATNKVEFCARYGILIKEEEWPCQALPQSLVGDRGELKAQMSERFVNLNVDVLNAPSYRGDLKPYVESHFHITNETIRQLLTGSTEAKQMVRGDYDPARESAWTIEEFNRFLIIYFLTYNKSALSRNYIPTKEMFAEQIELTPLKVWNWDKGRRLLHEKTRDELRHNLLPRGIGKVTRFGIRYKNLFYTSQLGLDEGWFEGNGLGIEGMREVEISYDPRNCSSIFIKRGKKLVTCLLTGRSKEFEGLHFDEVDKLFEYRDMQIKEQEKNEKQHKAELHAFTGELDKLATKVTKGATQDTSLFSRKQNMRETRATDSKVWGSISAITHVEGSRIADGLSSTNAEVIPFPDKESEVERVTLADGNIDIQMLFSRKSKERRRKDEPTK